MTVPSTKQPYLREVQQELKRIKWTTKEELVLYTKVVIGATFAFAFIIFFADLLISKCIGFLQFLVRLIG
ncbi:MAG: preprotein translocase subunit SecE [Parachlamydiales bacterium]|nr:preprotein translocase subunit SecE [Parachlamydiales bacterium]